MTREGIIPVRLAKESAHGLKPKRLPRMTFEAILIFDKWAGERPGYFFGMQPPFAFETAVGRTRQTTKSSRHNHTRRCSIRGRESGGARSIGTLCGSFAYLRYPGLIPRVDGPAEAFRFERLNSVRIAKPRPRPDQRLSSRRDRAEARLACPKAPVIVSGKKMRIDMEGARVMLIHYVEPNGKSNKSVRLLGALARKDSSVPPQFRFACTPGEVQFLFSNGVECGRLYHRLANVEQAVTQAKRAVAVQHLDYFSWDRVLPYCEALCVRGLKTSRAFASLASLALGLLLTLPSVRAHAEYLLGPGDKLEIQVSAAFTRGATVNADGDIVMPRIGRIPLAGLSLTAAQDRLQQAYRNEKVFQSAEVLIQVLEYRPFFMDGDIAKPGAYPYQPDITIRQAITLAGGLDMVRFRFGENPFIRAADLRADYETLAIERFKLELRRRSLEAELKGSPEVSLSDVDAFILPQATVKDLAQIERQRFVQRCEAFGKESALLKNAAKQAQDNLEAMKAEMESESAAAQQEERNVAAVEAMVNRGVAPSVRLTEAQRDLANAKSRFYATHAQISSSERGLSEAQLALNRSEDAHRAELLADMDAAATALEKLAAQEKAAAEKFAVVGGARTALYTQTGDEASLAIYRRTDRKVEQIPGTLDTEIVAGDVISINLKPQRLLGLAAQPLASQAQ